jgi:hypothetical protein
MGFYFLSLTCVRSRLRRVLRSSEKGETYPVEDRNQKAISDELQKHPEERIKIRLQNNIKESSGKSNAKPYSIVGSDAIRFSCRGSPEYRLEFCWTSCEIRPSASSGLNRRGDRAVFFGRYSNDFHCPSGGLQAITNRRQNRGAWND